MEILAVDRRDERPVELVDEDTTHLVALALHSAQRVDQHEVAAIHEIRQYFEPLLDQLYLLDKVAHEVLIRRDEDVPQWSPHADVYSPVRASGRWCGAIQFSGHRVAR